jgi:hypothetical protein
MNAQITFAIETVKNAKTAMISNGYVDAQLVFATCNKLSAMLSLDINIVIEIFELV